MAADGIASVTPNLGRQGPLPRAAVCNQDAHTSREYSGSRYRYSAADGICASGSIWIDCISESLNKTFFEGLVLFLYFPDFTASFHSGENQ